MENKKEICSLCPRECNVDRDNGKKGYCGVGNTVKIARAALHMWEEPCISGSEGSGTVFFSGCNLGCIYCQNRDISKGQRGKEITIEELAEIFLKLQSEGANNINLVTPSHYVNQIISALDIAKSNGLKLPIVYNTGSYEKVETLKKLEGYVDIYLPDCKYYNNERAEKYSNAPNYFEIAIRAIEEMHRQVGSPEINEKGIMKRGVIVRHLILPGGTKDSKKVISELFDRFKDDVYMSIMSQYTPVNSQGMEMFSELNRKITKREYEKVVDYALELGVENAFVQEGDVANDSFIPDWDIDE